MKQVKIFKPDENGELKLERVEEVKVGKDTCQQRAKSQRGKVRRLHK